MKLLLCIAETPYLNEWFSEMVRVLSAPPYSVEFILYYNSKLAHCDKSGLFPARFKTYFFDPEPPTSSELLPVAFDWSVAYISWERQWYQRAMKYDRENIPRITRALHASLSRVMLEEKPDFALYELPSSILGEVLYKVCEASGYCGYISITQSRIPSRIDICDAKYKYKAKDSNTPIPSDEEIAAMSDALVSKKAVPSYMADKGNSLHSVSVTAHYLSKTYRLRFFFKHLPLLFKNDEYETREAYGMLWANLRNHVLRRIRKEVVERHYSVPDGEERYYLFPLHLVPESSVSGQAMYFSDIVSTIRYIAFSLPLDAVLYVKEHPAAVGTRSRNFYREMKKIPNVRLVSYKAKAIKLIDGCEAMITLTSTMGLEAALAGKKVYILGDVVFESHPNCVRVRTIEALKSALYKNRSTDFDGSLDKANLEFWREYYSNTIEGNVLNPKGKNDFPALINMLARKIQKQE